MTVKVYVITDPLAINFLVDADIDGFKEYLESDEYLDFGEPEVFETEEQALAFCAGLGYGANAVPLPTAIRSALARKSTCRSSKPSKITNYD